MLTNQAIYNDLLGYLGHEPGNGAPEEDQAILQAVNGGLQDIWTNGPEFLREKRMALNYPAPTTLTIPTVQGSDKIAGEPFTDRMIGCLIRIAGEDTDNEVASNNSLMFPIVGPSVPTASATVYYHAHKLPHDMIKVSGNVFIGDTYRELKPLPYKENTLYKQHPTFQLDPYYTVHPNVLLQFRIGFPLGYYVERMPVNQPESLFALRLCLWPIPDQQFTIKFLGETSAPQLCLEDLEIARMGGATKTVAIPSGLHETTFLPLARLRLSTYPHFLPSKRELIVAQGATALEGIRKVRPQAQGGAVMRPPYFIPGTR